MTKKQDTLWLKMSSNAIKCKLIFIFLFLKFSCFSEENIAITYRPAERLGDQIVDYMHAKWIAYKWGYPFYYHPFKYSDQLVLHDFEKPLTSEVKEQFTNHEDLFYIDQLNKIYSTKTLLYLSHYPDSPDEHASLFWKPELNPVPVDWSDQTFLKLMRTLIAPKYPLKLISPPSGIVSVALHYRSGEGYDAAHTKRALPLRFPYPDFYIEQLKRLYDYVGKDRLYVYIFTDHPSPVQIKVMLQENLQNYNILIDCRTGENSHTTNVLEDLFSLMQFDCIIRSVSHFAATAARLGNFKIDISPKKGHFVEDRFKIDEVNFISNSLWNDNDKKWVTINKES